MSATARIFLEDVSNEAHRATAIHGEFNSAHECYAVLLEEVDEFWEIVRQKRSQRDPLHLYKELVQIAAMCVKGATSLDKFVKEGK